jgi:hypothetical protein
MTHEDPVLRERILGLVDESAPPISADDVLARRRSESPRRSRTLMIGWAAMILALVIIATTVGFATAGNRSSAGTKQDHTTGTHPKGASVTLPNSTHGIPPSDLPRSCSTKPRLTPISPTPTWPTGYQILSAIPSALAAQYPTVFGQLTVAPAKPGENDVDVNSHFVVLETVRDPLLEAEARSAYRAPLSVAFGLTPYSWACLTDVNNIVGNMWNAAKDEGISVIGSGIGLGHVVVSVTACKPVAQRSAEAWFAKRWGSIIKLSTCSVMPTAGPLVITRKH